MVQLNQNCAYPIEMKVYSVRGGGFVRVPNGLLEPLLRARLNGTQWRVLLWVVRYTHGWNRPSTTFTWYRIARDLTLDRATTYRAGRALLQAGVLIRAGDQLALQGDSRTWADQVLSRATRGGEQLSIPGMNVAHRQRDSLSEPNATVVNQQRNRWPATTLFRQTKDRCKDRPKTYKDRHPSGQYTPGEHLQNGERRHLAGAARPVAGKYDRFS